MWVEKKRRERESEWEQEQGLREEDEDDEEEREVVVVWGVMREEWEMGSHFQQVETPMSAEQIVVIRSVVLQVVWEWLACHYPYSCSWSWGQDDRCNGRSAIVERIFHNEGIHDHT